MPPSKTNNSADACTFFAVESRDLPRCEVTAWRPAVPGVVEAFHASMRSYTYPPHCHDVWTVLAVDDGEVSYRLDRRERHASPRTVDVLPPHVVHDGGPVGAGFRKRVLYLDDTWLPAELAGRAVDDPTIVDVELRRSVEAVHAALVGHDELDAEAALAAAIERIVARLQRHQPARSMPERATAERLRQFLDDRRFEAVTLQEAGAVLDRNPTHLVRSFTATFGVSPHAYVTGRRVEAARRRLLAGQPVALVAATVGFHDQAHLTRHFVRHTATTPARFARGSRTA